jgi:hypothetical protein
LLLALSHPQHNTHTHGKQKMVQGGGKEKIKKRDTYLISNADWMHVKFSEIKI